MSHEPGRERAMTYRCEKCGTTGSLFYNENHDEYWCESCIDNANEDAWQAQQARDLESPREEQLRTWAEHQEAHKR